MKTLVMFVLAAILVGCAENPVEVQPSSNTRAWEYADLNHEAIYVDVAGSSKLVVLELVYTDGSVVKNFLQTNGYPVLTVTLSRKDSLQEVRIINSPIVEKWQWVRGSELDTLSVLGSIGYSSRYLGAIQVTQVETEMLLHAEWYNAPQLSSDFAYTLRNDGWYRDPCNSDGVKRVE